MKQITKSKVIEVIKIAGIVALMTVPMAALAQFDAGKNSALCTGSGLNCTAGANGLNGLIKVVINWLLGIAFGVAVLFLIIGGFWYITSAGNEETAEKGKGTAINAIIGIVIIILSYVIINVISGLVSSAGTGAGP